MFLNVSKKVTPLVYLLLFPQFRCKSDFSAIKKTLNFMENFQKLFTMTEK